MNEYQKVFMGVESTLISTGSENLPIGEIKNNLDRFKQIENKEFTDEYYYRTLVSVIFYSGFRAATITSKMDRIDHYFSDYEFVAQYGDSEIENILSDKGMIRNKRKIQSCIDNAKVFNDIIQDYSSINDYIDSFESTKSFENLMLLKEELEYRFSGLGRITTYHFLTDIGLPVLKPDRVIGRIFTRLGFIESSQQLLKTVIQGRKFARAAGHPIRYIDIVFVAYGQVKSEVFGIERGICLKNNPSCHICGVTEFCNYFAQVYVPGS